MKTILFSYLVALTFYCYGQDITVLEGNPDFLKGQSDIKIEFDYENVRIADGETEKQYLTRKIEYLNNKDAGRGDKFDRTWKQFRLDYFEPKFIETFLNYSRLRLNSDTAKYTLVFKPTQYTDKALLVPPNEEAKPSSKTTFMDGEAWVVEAKNRENVLLILSIKKISGRDRSSQWVDGRVGANGLPIMVPTMAYYDVRVRLSFTYANAGKELGSYISEKMK